MDSETFAESGDSGTEAQCSILPKNRRAPYPGGPVPCCLRTLEAKKRGGQMKFQNLFIVIAVLIVGLAVSGYTHQVEKPLALNLEAEGIKTVEIECGSGYLKIKGVEGLNRIEVDATLVVKGIDEDEIEEFKKDNVELSLEKRGGKAVLLSKIKSGFSVSGLFKHKEARINLDLRVPKNLDLDIEDGSGLIEISAVNGSVELEDGSGSILMTDIGGNVSIEDGSGSTVVENIGGNFKINDGSGGIKVTKVDGDVSVDDSSGTISIYQVKGSVEVEDGSGGIIIDGVDKDVWIKGAGSGSLTIRNVSGKVRE
jgi:hypothetical protein